MEVCLGALEMSVCICERSGRGACRDAQRGEHVHRGLSARARERTRKAKIGLCGSDEDDDQGDILKMRCHVALNKASKRARQPDRHREPPAC